MLNNKAMIISSGDISDVDGFFALAEYAKTGADVLFIMNYPAYINVAAEDPTFETKNPGLGFKYSAQQVFDSLPADCPDTYLGFMRNYESIVDANKRMKCAMTDLAFSITKNVWAEVGRPEERGRLFFMIGGVNTVNPFSAQAIKNEVLVFADMAPKQYVALDSIEGAVYNELGLQCQDEIDLSSFRDIYLDFNGSMAHFSDDSWLVKALKTPDVQSKVRGAFIMGGVEAETPPQTMPAIAGKLNRLSSATMNQLYHPRNTGRFFAILAERRIPAHIVTNNAVADLTTWSDAARTRKTYDGVAQFLCANGLGGALLGALARAYYEPARGAPPPRKPFDMYTAVALRGRMGGRDVAAPGPAEGAARRLFYSDELGVALVSAAGDWAAALAAYGGGIDTAAAADDSDFVRAKKESFRRELAAMAGLRALPWVEVIVADAALDPATRRLAPSRPAAGRKDAAGPAGAGLTELDPNRMEARPARPAVL